MIETKYVEKSDLAWYTEAQIFLEENNINKAIQCAQHYWNGDVFHNKDYSCMELRTKDAKVVDLIELNVEKNELKKALVHLKIKKRP